MEISGFSITGILREINVREYKSDKTAVFAILGALNFVIFGEFQPLKSEKNH